MDKLTILFVISTLVIFSSALKIKELSIPEIVFLESTEPIILDCDYDVGNDTSQPVVKWFHDEKPIYQWIFGKQPQGMGPFSKYLDLSYKATNDENSMYRALKIIRLDLNLTGVYKCVVFTLFNEDTMSDKMIVVNRPEDVQITQINPDDQQVQFMCTAYGIFPEPAINITNSDSVQYDDIEKQSIQGEDNLFNVTQVVSLSAESLDANTVFTCEISIPNTMFTMSKNAAYFSGSMTTEIGTETQFVDYDTTTMIYYLEDNAASLISSNLWFILLFAISPIFFRT